MSLKGSITAVGDSIAEVSREAVAKFPNESCIIKRQGERIAEQNIFLVHLPKEYVSARALLSTRARAL